MNTNIVVLSGEKRIPPKKKREALRWFLKNAGGGQVNTVHIEEMKTLFRDSESARRLICAMMSGLYNEDHRYPISLVDIDNQYLVSIMCVDKVCLNIDVDRISTAFGNLSKSISNEGPLTSSSFEVMDLLYMVRLASMPFFSRFYWQLDGKGLLGLAEQLNTTLVRIIDKYVPRGEWASAKMEAYSLQKNITNLLQELAVISVASRGAVVLIGDETKVPNPCPIRVTQMLHTLGMRRWLRAYYSGESLNIPIANHCPTFLWMKEKFSSDDGDEWTERLFELHAKVHSAANKMFEANSPEEREREKSSLIALSVEFMLSLEEGRVCEYSIL